MLFCPSNISTRSRLWVTLSIIMSREMFRKLITLSPDLQINEMLRGFTAFSLSDETIVDCLGCYQMCNHAFARTHTHILKYFRE